MIYFIDAVRDYAIGICLYPVVIVLWIYLKIKKRNLIGDLDG